MDKIDAARRKIMNYFLDTNIIIILFEGRNNEIERDIRDILIDNHNSFCASSISLLEIAQLYRKKRFKNVDYEVLNTGKKFIIEVLNILPAIKILPFEEEHAVTACDITFVPNHNDPNDLAIIAHAISEGIPIITCDDKFPEYEHQGAKVLHNSRKTRI